MDFPTSKKLKEIKNDIKLGRLNGDYGDFVLMTKLWHCTPTEFENQTEYNINLHKHIFSLELQKENIESRRESLKSKALKYG